MIEISRIIDSIGTDTRLPVHDNIGDLPSKKANLGTLGERSKVSEESKSRRKRSINHSSHEQESEPTENRQLPGIEVTSMNY